MSKEETEAEHWTHSSVGRQAERRWTELPASRLGGASISLSVFCKAIVIF